MAVLMVLLVPALLYVFLIQDLLFAKLENQEVAASSAWDFTSQDYRHRDGARIAGEIETMGRKTHLDHSSAWNDYDDRKADSKEGSADARLHQIRKGHPCWFAQGVKPLTCRFDSKVKDYKAIDGRFGGLAQDSQVRQAVCSAALAYVDDSLPAQFLQSWTKQRVRPWANHAPFLFPEEQFSLLVDPWALGWIKEHGGGPARGHHDKSLLDPMSHPKSEQSEFTSWVKVPYGMHGNDQRDTAREFLKKLVDDEFLSDSAGDDGFGDNLDTPPVAFSADPEATFGGFAPSGLSDDRVRNTRRQRSYLGRPESTW